MNQPQARHATTTTGASHDPLIVPEPALAAFLTPEPGMRPRHRAFPCRADQAARARQFARRYLADCPAADDAELLTSEIVTNSILHSHSRDGGTIHVWIAHQCYGTLRVAVTDNGPLAIAPTSPEPVDLTESGRGLSIVDAIATRWGRHTNRHATTVWFEIHCQPGPGTILLSPLISLRTR